jgi:predicted metal-binding membrane protein
MSSRLTLVETLLRRERVVLATLAGATLLCWAWIVPMARDMYGAMTGPSAWMMTTRWDLSHVLLLWAMWAVMMAGMMLPSAAPILLLFAASARSAADAAPAEARVAAMAGGYLLIWSLFSVGAVVLQRLLSAWLVLTPMMEASSPRVSGTLLLLAGVYQVTPFKWTCLRACRSPLGFVTSRARPGTRGAFAMGVEHGLHCLGCCWALMLLLFAGGVMNLLVIGLLTLVVLVEKLAPLGRVGTWAIGAASMGAGVWLWTV